MIGLILKRNETDWWLELSLFFGDSQRQAKAFYNSNQNISHLENTGWELYPNFHVSFMTSNLVWFESDEEKHYLEFWKKNVEKIYQQQRDQVPNYLKWLVDEKIIYLTDDIEEKLDEKFYDTDRQTLNICPGFGFIFSFTSSDAEELDKSGKLKSIIAEKIREGLKVVGIDGNDLLKKF